MSATVTEYAKEPARKKNVLKKNTPIYFYRLCGVITVL